MLRYQKLPKSVTSKTMVGVALSGISLGVAIFIEGFVMLYGLVGLFSLYFYPSSNLLLTGGDIFILSVIAVTAGLATVCLGFLAYYMEKLSKKARPLSQLVWVPMLLSVTVLLWQRTGGSYTYHLSWTWMWLSYEAIILAGVIPALVLHTKEGRKLYNQ